MELRQASPCYNLWRRSDTAVPSSLLAIKRFRSRRDAEKVLAEIIRDGGKEPEYRIEEDADGSCLIAVLEEDGARVAGTLGA